MPRRNAPTAAIKKQNDLILELSMQMELSLEGLFSSHLADGCILKEKLDEARVELTLNDRLVVVLEPHRAAG